MRPFVYYKNICVCCIKLTAKNLCTSFIKAHNQVAEPDFFVKSVFVLFDFDMISKIIFASVEWGFYFIVANCEIIVDFSEAQWYSVAVQSLGVKDRLK